MYKRLTLIMAIVMILALTGCQAFGKNSDTVFYGTAEMEQIDISAEAAGIIKEIKASEGEFIKKSTIIGIIDIPENTIRGEQAELGVQNASNELEKVNAGAREEEVAAQKAAVKQIEAQISSANSVIKQGQEAIKQSAILLKQAEINAAAAKDTYDFKQKVYEDFLILYKNENISKQDLDTAEYNMKIAKNSYENALKAIEGVKAQYASTQIQLEVQKAQLESLRQQMVSANQKLNILINGAVDTSITTAVLGRKQAETNFELSKLAIEKSEIKSEIEGVINTINYGVGEYVLPGSVVATVSNTKNLWVKIYVSEKLLPQLKLNKEVSISSDFIKENIKGKIINISSEAEYTPMNIITKKDRERLVYAVKVQITDNMDKVKAGMLLNVQLK